MTTWATCSARRTLFENGASLFERKANSANQRRQRDAADKKIEELEAKLQREHEGEADLIEEDVQPKKSIGAPESSLGGPRNSRYDH